MKPGSRLLKLFSTAVIDQVVLSGANFAVGLILIRMTGDADYGLFVLVQSGILLLVTAQGAWLSGPLSVLAPRRGEAGRVRMISTVERGQRRWVWRLLAVSLLVPLLLYGLGRQSWLHVTVIALGLFAGAAALQREFLRSTLLIHGQPQAMLRVDLVYVAVFLAGAAAAAFAPGRGVLWAVGGMFVAALACGRLGAQAVARSAGWSADNEPGVWAEMRPLATWSLIGATIHWCFFQGYNYILAGRLDLEAVADVNAARLLLMPIFVMTIGIKGLLTPSVSAWLSEHGVDWLLRQLLLFVGGVVLLGLIYFGVLWLLRNWLVVNVLHNDIVHQDLLIGLWGAAALLNLSRDLLQTALLALQRFKALAALTAVCAALSLSILMLGLSRWGAAAAVIGITVGEALSVIGVCMMLWGERRRAAVA